MALETRLAAAHWDRVRSRDVEKTYNLHRRPRSCGTGARRSTGTPGSTALGAPEDAFAEVLVRQPSFLDGRRRRSRERPLDDWKAWLPCAPPRPRRT